MENYESNYYNLSIIIDILAILIQKVLTYPLYYGILLVSNQFFSPMTMDNIDFLTDVYEDYITKHHLPYRSADEQDTTDWDEKHILWLRNFNEMWELACDSGYIVPDESTGW